jgi:hypothetical protein
MMLALSNDFSLPVTRSFVEFDAATQTLVPASETLFRIALGPLVALFLFISAGAHFMISTVLYKRYVGNLKKGIYDIGSLIMIFSLNATMIFFGYIMEVHNQTTEKTNWSSFIFGCFAGFIPWVVIAIYLLRAAPPDFVYYIFVSIAIFFNIFALIMALQYRAKGKWKDYLYGERMYVVMSLVAKSLLAWQVFAGTLRPM